MLKSDLYAVYYEEGLPKNACTLLIKYTSKAEMQRCAYPSPNQHQNRKVWFLTSFTVYMFTVLEQQTNLLHVGILLST